MTSISIPGASIITERKTPINFHGMKGRSGRKRKSLNRTEAMRILTLKLPKAIETIAETVEGTNRDKLRYEAAVEIKDSCLGKPKVTTEIEGGELLSTGVVLQVLQAIYDRRKQSQTYLITGGKDVQRQGVTEENNPGQSKALQGVT